MFISLVSLVKAHWLSEITAASCKWCVKWKGFAHPANTEKTLRKLCHWTGLGGKEENSCDTRRIKPRIYRQIQKINQVWCNFLFFCAGFFFSFLSCSVSFCMESCIEDCAKLSGSGLCDLNEVLNLKWSLICALRSSMFYCIRGFVLFLSTSMCFSGKQI